MKHRKIPTTKRHGKVRALDKEGHNQLYNQEKKKTNNAPRNIKDQEIPRKALLLKEAVKQTKESNNKRIKKKKQNKFCIKLGKLEEGEKGMDRPTYPLPDYIEKGESESKESFIYRVNALANKAITEVQHDMKFGIERYQTEEEKAKAIEAKKSSRKSQFRKRKLERKREKKQEKDEMSKCGFSHLKDDVAFGEVVHAPPKLNFNPKIVKKLNNKPTKKKEKLTTEEREKQEEETFTIVQQYRLLKARKYEAQRKANETESS